MNGWDYLILALVLAAVAAALWATIRSKKKGGCRCGCEGCPHRSGCQKDEKN